MYILLLTFINMCLFTEFIEHNRLKLCIYVGRLNHLFSVFNTGHNHIAILTPEALDLVDYNNV